MQDQINLIERIREAYKTIEKNKINVTTYKRALNAIFRAITNYMPVKYVSKAAKAKADKLGIDLTTMTWDNQTKKNYDPKRKYFKYEHCNTIDSLILRVLNTEEEIKKIVKDTFVCWILVEEDDELESHKYRKKRPDGWKKCYKECGIEPILNK